MPQREGVKPWHELWCPHVGRSGSLLKPSDSGGYRYKYLAALLWYLYRFIQFSQHPCGKDLSFMAIRRFFSPWTFSLVCGPVEIGAPGYLSRNRLSASGSDSLTTRCSLSPTCTHVSLLFVAWFGMWPWFGKCGSDEGEFLILVPTGKDLLRLSLFLIVAARKVPQ